MTQRFTDAITITGMQAVTAQTGPVRSFRYETFQSAARRRQRRAAWQAAAGGSLLQVVECLGSGQGGGLHHAGQVERRRSGGRRVHPSLCACMRGQATDGPRELPPRRRAGRGALARGKVGWRWVGDAAARAQSGRVILRAGLGGAMAGCGAERAKARPWRGSAWCFGIAHERFQLGTSFLLAAPRGGGARAADGAAGPA
jgi:hypothetical protein